MPRKVKYETVEDVSRNYLKIKNFIMDNFGIPPEGEWEVVADWDMVLRSHSKSRRHPPVLMKMTIRFPSNLLAWWLGYFGVWPKVSIETDLSKFYRLGIGLDELGRIFTYSPDDPACRDRYYEYVGPYVMAVKMHEEDRSQSDETEATYPLWNH